MNIEGIAIVYLETLSDRELNDYYNMVDAVIYPTRYEGFGLPVLEAMACGTPILTTRIEPIKSIAGKGAWYFDLDKPMTLVKQIKTMRGSREKRREKVLQGYHWLVCLAGSHGQGEQF